MKEHLTQMIKSAEYQLEAALQELTRADELVTPTKEFELRVAEIKGELNVLRRLHGMLV